MDENTRRRVKGGFWAVVGYVLSPLSFWNDLFVNIPLAYAFGFVFGLVNQSLFLPMMIVGYWITNIAGMILLHRGAVDAVSKEKKKHTRRDLIKDLGISVAYTALIVGLAAAGVLQFPDAAQKFIS